MVLLIAGAVSAQESAEELARRQDGFSVNTLTVSGTYFSQSVPQDVSLFEDVFLGSGESLSGTVDLRFRRTRRKSLLLFESASTYGNRIQQTTRTNWSSDAANSWNEVATALASRSMGHWRVGASADAEVMNFDEAMFSTSASARIIGAARDFHTEAAALMNPQTPRADGLQSDPTTVRFLFGRRTASAGGSGNIAYLPSPRLQIGFNAGASKIRHINDGTDVIEFDYPQATTYASGGYMTYSPSRLTQIGVEAKAVYTDTTFAQTNGASGSVSFQKMARKHWFWSGSFGLGWTTMLANGTSNYQSYVYSAGGGFSARAHSFTGYYNRDLNELYVPALGPDSAFFSTVSASWFWSPPRAEWWSHMTLFHYRDQPPAGIPAPTSWRALEQVGRQFGRHFIVTGEYSIGRTGARRYIRAGKRFQLEENGARVSFSWSPRRLDRPR